MVKSAEEKEDDLSLIKMYKHTKKAAKREAKKKAAESEILKAPPGTEPASSLDVKSPESKKVEPEPSKQSSLDAKASESNLKPLAEADTGSSLTTNPTESRTRSPEPEKGSSLDADTSQPLKKRKINEVGRSSPAFNFDSKDESPNICNEPTKKSSNGPHGDLLLALFSNDEPSTSKVTASAITCEQENENAGENTGDDAKPSPEKDSDSCSKSSRSSVVDGADDSELSAAGGLLDLCVRGR